ncbi:MAG: rhodanese-like domain-containing protein, partial [Alphaproteobacteria bacterium]
AHLIGTIPGLVVLDVRTPVEHADGRIRLSRNMDFFADDFEQQISALDRQASYLIYCRSGGRSRFTLDLLEELGFSNAVHMPAGMEGWCAAGLPVVTA